MGNGYFLLIASIMLIGCNRINKVIKDKNYLEAAKYIQNVMTNNNDYRHLEMDEFVRLVDFLIENKKSNEIETIAATICLSNSNSAYSIQFINELIRFKYRFLNPQILECMFPVNERINPELNPLIKLLKFEPDIVIMKTISRQIKHARDIQKIEFNLNIASDIIMNEVFDGRSNELSEFKKYYISVKNEIENCENVKKMKDNSLANLDEARASLAEEDNIVMPQRETHVNATVIQVDPTTADGITICSELTVAIDGEIITVTTTDDELMKKKRGEVASFFLDMLEFNGKRTLIASVSSEWKEHVQKLNEKREDLKKAEKQFEFYRFKDPDNDCLNVYEKFVNKINEYLSKNNGNIVTKNMSNSDGNELPADLVRQILIDEHELQKIPKIRERIRCWQHQILAVNKNGLLAYVICEDAPGFCGSGGCGLLIYSWNGQKFKSIYNGTDFYSEIKVSNDMTNGMCNLNWRDANLSGDVFEHVLKYDGTNYK